MSCLGSDGLVQPEVRLKQSHTLFDTTTNDLKNPILWVTYHDGIEVNRLFLNISTHLSDTLLCAAQQYAQYIVEFNQ